MDATVAIIGAGPLGIELAVALKKAGIAYLHFDAKQIGYTISWFPPQTRFFSSPERIAIAGVPLQTPDQMKATREEYLAYLRTVVQQFDLRINTYETVRGIDRVGLASASGTSAKNVPSAKADPTGFTLTTMRGGAECTYRVGRIVLATGGTATPRRLGVPGEDLPHVHPHWTDPHDYFRKRVLIVGGKNSAIEAALRFHRAGAYVSISYRRAELPEKSIKYWLLPEIRGLMKSGEIVAHLGTQVVEITSSQVRLSNGQSVAVDFVVPQIGYSADMSLARLAGVELRGPCEAPVFNPETMETNVPGVYVCGTVVGGTQDKYEVFIENGHAHVERIVAHLLGRRGRVDEVVYAQPES